MVNPRRIAKRCSNILVEDGFFDLIYISCVYVVRRIGKALDLFLRTVLPYQLYFGFRKSHNNLYNNYDYISDYRRILWIDPEDIEYYINGRYSIFRFWYTGAIISGDWDLNLDRFEDNPIYITLKQRYIDQLDWEETKLVAESLNGESSWRGATTKSELSDRASSMDKLHDDIVENGFKNSVKTSDKKYPYSLLDNINVGIGRCGQFVLVDGRHRLALAKIIGVDKIPVRVVIRHKMWQNAREELGATADSPETPESEYYPKLAVHPDMEDIV